MVIKLFKKYRQFIIFGLVGCCNTLVDFLIFSLLHSVGYAPYVCQVGGYTSGILCSFLLNRKFTFGADGGSFWGQIILFVLMNLFSMAVSAWLITVLVDFGVNAYLAKIAVTAVVMIMNFFGYKYIVFRKRNADHE